MRWWAGVWVGAAVLLLGACGSSGGSGPAGGQAREPAPPVTSAPVASAQFSPAPSSSASPDGPRSSGPASTPPAAPRAGCGSGRTEVTVAAGGPDEQRLCVRPGTLVSLTLRPRADDQRWTAVRSAAPALVVVSQWRVDADGTAHASLRCAGARGGTAKVTALAKAPDVAGAPRAAFTLDVNVILHAREG